MGDQARIAYGVAPAPASGAQSQRGERLPAAARFPFCPGAPAPPPTGGIVGIPIRLAHAPLRSLAPVSRPAIHFAGRE